MLKSLLVVGTMVVTFGACSAYASGPNCASQSDMVTTRIDGTQEYWKVTDVQAHQTLEGGTYHDFMVVQIKEAKNPETGLPFCKISKKAVAVSEGRIPEFAKKRLGVTSK